MVDLFFFFKQKTAYDMRISDWSSDVCSSDLRRLFEPNQPNVERLGSAGSPLHRVGADQCADQLLVVGMDEDCRLVHECNPSTMGSTQIGRPEVDRKSVV